MARHDPTVRIPEKLLSNFDPLVILEPQKCDTVPAVDKLIDVGDFPFHKDVNASLMGQKSDYSLIDLYENFYVTARQVKLKNNDVIGIDINDSDSYCTISSSGCDSGSSISSKADSSSSGADSSSSGADSSSSGADINSNISNGFDRSDSVSIYDDEAFKQFLDKMESGENIDWTKDLRPQKEPKDLTAKPVKEDETDPEEFIYKVLSEKTIEKRILDEIKNSAATTSTLHKNGAAIAEIPKLKVLKSPNIALKASEKKIKSTNFSKEIATSPKIKTETNVSQVSCANLKVLNGPKLEIRKSEKNVEEGCCQTCKLSKSSINKTEIDIMAEISRLKLNNDLFYNKNINKSTPCAFNINNVTKTDFTVIAAKKNEKEYKKRIQKPESLTSTYKNGADFDEKIIVLPQIMARINARKTYLQEKSLLKRRLVLDGGKKPSNKNTNDKDVGEPSRDVNKCSNCANTIKSPNTDKNVYQTFGEVNPKVLMEDCNKERLRALKTGQTFIALVQGK